MIVNNVLKKLWKETIMTQFKVHPKLFLEGLWKTTKLLRMVGTLIKIRTG
jgi:hypothetical protein